ncbi:MULTISPECIES: SdpI family protein [unclassified Corynebacterium]|uniref:SdpI family protein n=1 Tax=unclassified Corynebacterium TaxID=2624378 RepID=UPI0029C9B842|nr:MULTISPECIES: SdpI family protein [unclassified Corynebacterium]WPF65828.1 SdpI family protein [Corynebacterium sp. 22KM0430]WPF68321.1 SdpI family protein [Corynebacterium sp. 21KM1197]
MEFWNVLMNKNCQKGMWMTVFSIVMAVTWFLAGGVLLFVAIKAGRGTLPKNDWVGIRTLPLLESDEAWVEGHRAAANSLKMSSVPLFVGGVICLVADDSFIAWVSIVVAVLLLVMTLVAARKAHAVLE